MPEVDKTTETYALDYEKRFLSEYKEIDLEYPKFRDYVSAQLKSSTSDARFNIVTAYDNTSDFQKFRNVPEYAYMFLIIQIYKSEYSAGYKQTILDIADNIHDYILLIEQCKFILWRIELAEDESAKDFLLHFIETYKISPYFITKTIESSSFTSNLLTELTVLFTNRSMFTYAFHILSFMETLDPGNEDILCTLASFSANIGRKDNAAAYLSKIKNPGEATERIRIKYGL